MSHGACWIDDEDVVLLELRYFIKALDCRPPVFLELSCCVLQLWWNIAIRVSIVGEFDSALNGFEIFQVSGLPTMCRCWFKRSFITKVKMNMKHTWMLERRYLAWMEVVK